MNDGSISDANVNECEVSASREHSFVQDHFEIHPKHGFHFRSKLRAQLSKRGSTLDIHLKLMAIHATEKYLHGRT